MDDASAPVAAGLVARIDELEARIAADLAEMRAIRVRLGAPPPRSAEPAAGAPPAPVKAAEADGTSRRRLIGGVVAGAAAAVGGVVLGAEPAAASTGAMTYGTTNDAGTDRTTLISGNITSTLAVVNDGAGFGVDASAANGPAVQGIANAGTGVWGRCSPGVGVRGITSTGTAGFFQAGDGLGVRISSDDVHLRLEPATGRPAPTADASSHLKGELVCDDNGSLWYCIATGTPGTWRRLVGTSTAGAFHLLKVPVRIYDSRAGSQPAVGLKTKLAANEIRTLDCKANASAVPSGATGVVLTCLLVDTSAGNGNFTVWANGQAKPSANTMVFGGSAGRFAATAISSVDSAAKVHVASSVATNLVVDVVGFYR